MPVEFSRTTKRKRITLPSGGTVDVPVITSISFLDTNDRGQETRFTIDNSAAGERLVTVEGVNGLQVERIQRFKVVDAGDRGQEIWYDVDNQTRGENPPPYFITHLKTHIVHYHGGGDSIESELIDEFVFLDSSDRGQETHYYLSQPQTDDAAQADPNDPEISDSANGIDPPWRTDPFQNIVKIGGPVTIFWAYQPESILPGPAVGGGYHFRNIFGNPTTVTLPDNSVGVVTGAFPTVPDVIFNPGPGVNFLAFPWWIVGPNTDTDSSGHAGPNYYDIPGSPSASFSHTWPFFGYTYQSGNAPAIFVSAGTLPVSFGPVAFTVDAVPWTLTNIHVAFTAIAEKDFGAAPTNMGWQPFFSATFEPPTA
jgi:hypothetical protein